MKKSKLLLTLQVFDKKNLNRLGKFIKSPYFNRDETLYVMFQRLVDQQNGVKIYATKEELWQELRPGKPYSDIRFRKFNSDLLNLVERFLIIEELEIEKKQKDILLLKAIGKRGIKVLQNSVINTSTTNLSKNPDLDTSNLFHRYLLEKEKYNLVYRYDRKQKSNIQDILFYFDQFYFAERYKLAADQISRSKFINVDLKDDLGQMLFQLLEKNETNLDKIGKVYQAVFQSQKTETIESYFRLRNIINSLDLPLSPAEGGSIYASQINFCIKQINSGDSTFIKELFIIYKELIEKGLILTNKQISPNTYSNITITALRNQEYDWAEAFLAEYSNYLPKDKKENLPKYELARLYFYKKDFSKVIEVLRGFEFEDQFDALQTKALQIYTYYELKEYEVLDSLLRSLKTYITRHKEIDPGRRKNFKNLIKIIAQMMSIIPGDKKKIEKLKATMAAMKGIAANREWLEEKILELERGK